MSYWLEQSTREIGIRVALGPTSRNVVRLVLRTGLTWVGLGMVIGMVAHLHSAWALYSLLFGITATDPVTLAAVIAVLTSVAAAASILPALRATRRSAVAIRHE